MNVEMVDIYVDPARAKPFAHYPVLKAGARPLEAVPSELIKGERTSLLTFSRYTIRLPIVQDGERIGFVVVQPRLDDYGWNIAITLLVAVMSPMASSEVLKLASRSLRKATRLAALSICPANAVMRALCACHHCSKAARMAAVPTSRGPPGCTHTMSSSSAQQAIRRSMSPSCKAS